MTITSSNLNRFSTYFTAEKAVKFPDEVDGARHIIDCYYYYEYYEFTKKKLSYRRDSAGRLSLCCTRSFKVTDFDISQKPICDFVFVNNANLHPVSPFPSYCRLLVKFASSTGGTQFDTLVRDEPLNSRPRKFCPKKLDTSL